MSSLKDLVAKQKQERLGEIPTGRAIVLLGGEEVTLEFTKLQPKQWLDLAAQHPPRLGAAIDVNIGFNPHSLAERYPIESVRLVDGEDLAEVSEDDYLAMFDVLDAIHIDTIGTVIWYLNVQADREAVAAARKASRAARSKKRSSRAS